MKLTKLVLLGTLARIISAQNSTGFQQNCTVLGSSLSIPRSTITNSSFVPARSVLQFPNGDLSCGRSSQAVSVNLCRIVLEVATSNSSRIKMEAWLPENWTGRFLSTGNGGLGGCIQYEDIDYATSLGFAAVGTNNGHDGMGGAPFLNSPEVITDFAYRALHTGVVIGKQISKAFYGTPQTKSYYLGCSTGGRQGFKEAQDFPEDFDGIVAGAPAFSFNNLTSWSSNFYVLAGPLGSDTFIPTEMWPVIHEDVLRQCDHLDGLVDGVLESPDLCNYNPDGLACGLSSSNGTNATNCLTTTQLQTLRSIYSALLDPNGDLVYPRIQPGAEATGFPQTYFTGQPFGASDWFKYAIFNDSNWDPSSLTPADWILSSKLNLDNIETWDGDLSALQTQGGKILHYHGLVDGTISSENSPRYYAHVSQTMNLSAAQLDDFYRYFRISGMAHCGGGPGAINIGNQARNTASLDPDENVLMAMVRWVEEGIAPETVTGTAFVNGDRNGGVKFKRHHCKWPKRNVYRGEGDPNDAESWNCVD